MVPLPCGCLVGGKAKGKYPDQKILVLPGQVLQPEAKGGVTPTVNLGS